MINIFVTYRCNLSCPYCFACDLRNDYPDDMDMSTFHRLLDWMRDSGANMAAFIGGEPTLHPRLLEMVEKTVNAGIMAVLFTNGLFSKKTAERIISMPAGYEPVGSEITPSAMPLFSRFVINYNGPDLYSADQRKRLHENLSRLRDAGAEMVFSKNFSRRNEEYEYLLEGCERYRINLVRYDISRPGIRRKNDHFTLDDTPDIISHIVGFVKNCEERGIQTGLDCSIRLCDLKVEDRRYLERVSMKFSGSCHPSIDIHPDLSASYCLPLRDIRVPDITAFSGPEEAMWHFAELVRPLRKTNISEDCFDCRDFMRRCQGGCMALRRASDTKARPKKTKMMHKVTA